MYMVPDERPAAVTAVLAVNTLLRSLTPYTAILLIQRILAAAAAPMNMLTAVTAAAAFLLRQRILLLMVLLWPMVVKAKVPQPETAQAAR